MSALTDPPEIWPAPVDLKRRVFAKSDEVVAVYDPEESSLRLASGRYFLPLVFHALVARPGLPLCQLLIEIQSTGPVCLRVTLAGTAQEPLSATRIRIPLRELVEEAMLLVAGHSEAGYDPQDFLATFAATRRPEPGKRLPDEFLEHVAEVYRYALRRTPTAPTEELGKAFDVSRSTAARWLVEARRRKLLGPAVPGQAGEQPPDREEDNDG